MTNRRRKSLLITGSVLSIALFAALWKVSAPIRWEKQIDEQAQAQFGKSQRCNDLGGVCFHVEKINYEAQGDHYYFDFTLRLHDTTDHVVMENVCDLRKVSDGYAGSCPIVLDGKPLHIELHP